MYEYKKIIYNFTPSNLRAKKIAENLDEVFVMIEEQAKEGWRFVQLIHPYSTNTVCMLVFEREASS